MFLMKNKKNIFLVHTLNITNPIHFQFTARCQDSYATHIVSINTIKSYKLVIIVGYMAHVMLENICYCELFDTGVESKEAL